MSYAESREHVENVLKGALAGMAGMWGVEFSRKHLLPDASRLKLHENFGICRDELQQRVGVAAAAAGLAAVEGPQSTNLKKVSAQLAGILLGTCVANYVSKLMS
jgi:hypothetical protein